MRKHQKDETTTYSDNDDRWNNATYKVDVVGVVESIGRPKSYPSSFYGEPPVMKYFMSINRDGQTQKVMVTCDDVERQKFRPAVGNKVHFKCTRDGEWLSIAARAPFEFWGDIFKPDKEEVWVGGLNKLDHIQVIEVREKSAFVCWVFPVNATDKLPPELEYAQEFRNNVMVCHLEKPRPKLGQLWCGTMFIDYNSARGNAMYGGDNIIETHDEGMVNCKKCLVKMKQKDDLTDVLLLSTFIPIDHVRLTGDTMDIKIDTHDVGKRCEVSEWIWNTKLEEKDWWVRPV